MARVRNNQGHRNKIANVFIRPYIEQENTQEREAFLQARETVKPLQDKTWQLASNIVGRFYTPNDVKMAYHLQNKFPNVNTIAKDSCFHFGYMNKADGEGDVQDDDGEYNTDNRHRDNDDENDKYITKHFDFRLDGNINGSENSRQNDFAYAYFRDELKGKVNKGRNVIPILTLNKNGEMVVARKIIQTLIGIMLTMQTKENLVYVVARKITLAMQESGTMIIS